MHFVSEEKRTFPYTGWSTVHFVAVYCCSIL